MRELILNRAEGNPFFVEELVRALIDAGAIVLEGAGPRPRARLMRWKFQRRFRASWLRVSIACLWTINKPYNALSVIGRIFQSRVLAYIYKEKRPDRLEAALGELQRREFIQSREQQAHQKRPGWKKGNTFSNTRSHMMLPTTRCFLPGARNCINLWRKRSNRSFPAGSKNFPRRLVFITSELKRPSGQYFILDERPNERKRPLPMRKRSAFYQSAIGQITRSGDRQFRESAGG